MLAIHQLSLSWDGLTIINQFNEENIVKNE